MTPDEVTGFAAGLGGVIVVMASEANGDPEMTWGDTFFFYDPDGTTVPARRLPFATIVTGDYAGFDEASDLSREGVFRVNMWVSRETFDRHASAMDVDYSALDEVIPHPIYARQSWLSVLNPGSATEGTAKELLTEAHDRARARYEKRS